MKEHKINSLNNFVSGWYIDDAELLDEIIEYHKRTPFKSQGAVGRGVDYSTKKSTDCNLPMDDIGQRYIKHIDNISKLYYKKYHFCNEYAPWAITEPIRIQHYKPSEAFYGWHCERTNGTNPIIAARHIVFMTYLNDVEDSGETEFYYQNLKIKPEKGLTLMWGADWTFTHRGIPSPSQDKYILTGWYGYVQ